MVILSKFIYIFLSLRISFNLCLVSKVTSPNSSYYFCISFGSCTTSPVIFICPSQLHVHISVYKILIIIKLNTIISAMRVLNLLRVFQNYFLDLLRNPIHLIFHFFVDTVRQFILKFNYQLSSSQIKYTTNSII